MNSPTSSWQDKINSLEGWYFGGKGSGLEDSLAALVVQGIKTATSSWYESYGVTEDPLPKVGEQSYILNSHDQAVCVVEVVRVEIKAFLEVDANFAFLEGEGDRSLAYWRKAHEDFFSAWASEIGLSWNAHTQHSVCETFKVLHIF